MWRLNAVLWILRAWGASGVSVRNCQPQCAERREQGLLLLGLSLGCPLLRLETGTEAAPPASANLTSLQLYL